MIGLVRSIARLIPFAIKTTKDPDHPGLGVSGVLYFGPRSVSVHLGWGGR